MRRASRPSDVPGQSSVRRDISGSAVVAGFIAVAISYAGPLLVVLEAARSGGLSGAQTASWVWAVSIGAGLVSLFGSWWTRQPVMVAWSIPGAALLVVALREYPYPDVLGAFVVCGVASALLGLTGIVGRLLQAIPKPITAAVLAGVLFPFCVKVGQAVAHAPVVAGGLVAGYLLGRRLNPRYAVFAAMAVGGVLALATGAAQPLAVHAALTTPTWTTPTFSVASVVGVALPLFIVTAAGQNAPGLIVMHRSGYDADDRLLLGASGIASVVFAPFGSHALSMAAVTAAIATSEESHPDARRRYVAGMSCGFFYILGGLAAATIVSLFSAIPPQMITALAGVALLPALQGSLYDTMHEAGHQPAVLEASLLTLVVSVSGMSPWGVPSAFWGLAAGLVAYGVLRRRARPAGDRRPPAGLSARRSRARRARPRGGRGCPSRSSGG